ncbi:MAG: sulfotransferase, partial [Polyangiaceae bacterium]|nr:sulfotransferase [Polyangiaceae bacterium]
KRKRGVDERIAAAEKVMKLYFGLLPEMRTIHPQHPLAPDECTFLLQQSFVSLDASARASVRSYVEHLMRRDLVPDYRYYRRQLQLLAWQERGEHWVLKSPVHLLALGPLLEVFPDACIVQTHRAPREVIPSLCSLTTLMRKLFVKKRDAERVGEDILTWWGALLDRGLADRARADEARFFDVNYGELLDDPLGAVRRIYAHFGYPFSAEMEARIERWLRDNPQDKHGIHRYSASQFGLTDDAIDRRFAAYMERFGLDRRRAA